MRVLRSSRQKALLNAPVKSLLNLSTRQNFTEDHFKKQYDRLISKISTSDIKRCLKSSTSEAKFYSDICREELKKLEEEKDMLEKKIHVETEINKKKDTEAAKIIKKMWEDANKAASLAKRKKIGSRKYLKPEDVKKVWEEAKKMSVHSKHKKRKLVAQKNQLDTKIHLAREAIKFCQKFGSPPTSKNVMS